MSTTVEFPLVNPRRTARGLALCLVAAVVALGCSGTSKDVSADSSAALTTIRMTIDRMTIIVPDAPLADLVRQVAGPGIEVASIVPAGADGHTYVPRPEDARLLARADMYIENGLNLNKDMTEFARVNYRTDTRHEYLISAIPMEELISTESAAQVAAHGHGHSFNAHVWPDPIYASAYVSYIGQILSEKEPAQAAGYAQRVQAFAAKLSALDGAVRTAIDTIPAPNRRLVVYHDSWSYFGRRYGLPVTGSIQPVNFAEPSAAEVRATIAQVKAAGVPAFFGSEVFPSGVLETIAKETGAKYVADLSDDRLPGSPGAPEHGYIGMMVSNIRSIVTALGGNATALDSVDPART